MKLNSVFASTVAPIVTEQVDSWSSFALASHGLLWLTDLGYMIHAHCLKKILGHHCLQRQQSHVSKGKIPCT